MKCKLAVFFFVLFFGITDSNCQTIHNDSIQYKYFVGTSLWTIANFFPDAADFYELDFGYRFTGKDAILLRALTWKYNAALGIPLLSSSYGSPDEKYPGYVRAFGISIGYQRSIWRGLFASVYATPFLQNFYDSDSKKTNTGFQLFLQGYIGYRVQLFEKRFYIEPSIACNYWPINTHFPASFLQKEKNWPNYFLCEPHFNLGFNF